jgi:N-acetylglucosamine kinase-like BadF-type ATPase
MAFARAPDGRTARSGGWGPLLGDEGSGYAIAIAGLRAAARSADGRAQPTLLTDRLLAKRGLTRPEELIGEVYRGGDRAALAALGPVVLDAADAGDPVAEEIVREAVCELASAAAAAARQLNLGGAFPVALAGGLFAASSEYRKRFRSALTARGLSIGSFELVDEPAKGAVRLALDKIASATL